MDDDEVEDNNKDDGDYKVISALELDRDMGFSRGHQGNQKYRPHNDDNEQEDDNEEDEDEVEYNDKDDNNNKEDNNYKGISVLRLNRDMGFSRGHQGHQRHQPHDCLLYTSPSPRDVEESRMPSSA